MGPDRDLARRMDASERSTLHCGCFDVKGRGFLDQPPIMGNSVLYGNLDMLLALPEGQIF